MRTACSLALALSALGLAAPAFAGAGDVDAGLYTGLVIPGRNHELYSPTDAVQKVLSPGPALGLRLAFRPLGALALEGETHIAAAGVQGAGGALLYAFRGQLQVLPPFELPAEIEPFLVAGLGDIGVSSATDSLGKDLDWAAHLGIGAKVPLSGNLGLRVDLRYLIADKNAAIASPGGHTEILLGLNYRLSAEGDKDGDGVVDSKDACPEETEVVNGYKDGDGCPDQLARASLTILDGEGLPAQGITVLADGEEVGRTDAKGMVVIDGLMPETSVVLRGEHFHMKRAEETTVELAEGGNAASLKMQWLPGRVRVVTKANGVPMEAATASFTGPKAVPTSVVNRGDQLFYLAPGAWQILVVADTFGTQLVELSIGPDQTSLIIVEMALEPAKVKVTLERVEILQQILFDTGSADIQGASMDLVKEVTGTILANPHIQKIQIQGHTDSVGSASSNRKLSQSRVESVMAWMVAHGVSADLLEAKGFGEDEPVASNNTEEGRAQNRRVVFAILAQETAVEP